MSFFSPFNNVDANIIAKWHFFVGDNLCISDKNKLNFS